MVRPVVAVVPNGLSLASLRIIIITNILDGNEGDDGEQKFSKAHGFRLSWPSVRINQLSEVCRA
jgi:hypothetical protein